MKQPLKITRSATRKRVRPILLIIAAGFLLVGFNALRGWYATTQLQQEPVKIEVGMVRQSRATSCGEAVIAMVYNFAYPLTPISEQQVIEYATANGYFTETLSPFTSPADMVKIARYYADDVSSGQVLSAGQGLDLLIRHLRRGEPVVIDVLSNFQDPESEAHFVVVTGLSVDPQRDNAVVIHYNDPLSGEFLTDDWDGPTGVWNAWRTNRDPGGSGWWLVLAPP